MKTTFLPALVILFLLSAISVSAGNPEGLVAYWKFNEGSGSAVKDELGKTDGVLVNHLSSTWTTGFEGKGLDFSQMASGVKHVYVDLPGNGVADMHTTNSFSISLLIKADKTIGTEQSIISKGIPNTTNGGWYHLSIKNGALRFMIWDNIDQKMTSPEGVLPENFPNNQWVHVVCVRDRASDNVYVYLNGKLLDSAADQTEQDIANDGKLNFGCVANDVWSSQFFGCLDEVQLYNIALSASAIHSLAVTYGMATSIAETGIEKLALRVYSDKTGQNLTIDKASDFTDLQVYNMTGARIRHLTNNSQETLNLNIADWPAGHYLLRGQNRRGQAAVSGFVKK